MIQHGLAPRTWIRTDSMSGWMLMQTLWSTSSRALYMSSLRHRDFRKRSWLLIQRQSSHPPTSIPLKKTTWLARKTGAGSNTISRDWRPSRLMANRKSRNILERRDRTPTSYAICLSSSSGTSGQTSRLGAPLSRRFGKKEIFSPDPASLSGEQISSR